MPLAASPPVLNGTSEPPRAASCPWHPGRRVNSVGFSRPAVCHQLQLVGPREEITKRSRLQPGFSISTPDGPGRRWLESLLEKPAEAGLSFGVWALPSTS